MRATIRGREREVKSPEAFHYAGIETRRRQKEKQSPERSQRVQIKTGARREVDSTISNPRPAPVLSPKEERGGLMFVEGGVALDERLFVLRDIVHCKNRI